MLQAKNIQKSYGNKLNKQNVLQGIDMQIEKGEFVTIMGASGSGKTTLLNVLSSIDQVSHGSIRIDGEPLTKMNARKLANFRKQDRKSTRLNSSHVAISYAVFCLKKK